MGCHRLSGTTVSVILLGVSLCSRSRVAYAFAGLCRLCGWMLNFVLYGTLVGNLAAYVGSAHYHNDSRLVKVS